MMVAVCSSLFLAGCAQQTGLKLNLKAGDTSMYKVSAEFIQEVGFEQPSLNKSSMEDTRTSVEVKFAQQIESVGENGKAVANITLKSIKYFIKDRGGVKFDFDSGRQADKDSPFAKLIGQNSFSMKAESIARYQPRDIAVVLDFSASMNVDSQLSRITSSGENREVVEASLLQIYQELGSPTYGSMQFTPQYISSTYNYTIKQELGLTYVPYPYPSGNWDDYINYVKTNYNVSRAGYQKKYGYLTLVNYWLERQPMYNQTPDLWKGSAEPAASVKDATNVFMDYIQEVDCDDRVSLVVYSSPSPAQDAVLEHGLTDDFASVQSTVQHRQAGHYDFYTNIGAGIRVGREELDDNARVGAKKMIVLMTDGQANRPYNTTYARTYALNQADLAAAARYPIVTISLGASADEVLMQDIANRTNGVHFNIPSDGSVTNYREQLLAIFRQIADDRPLVLVK